MDDNLLHQHLAKLTGQPASLFPANRANGMSTGIALKALGDAMRNPGVQIYIMDHASHSRNRKPDEFTQDLAQALVGKLGLVGFKFGKAPLGCYVVYNLDLTA
jgi:hypothetical protein